MFLRNVHVCLGKVLVCLREVHVPVPEGLCVLVQSNALGKGEGGRLASQGVALG